MISTATTKFLVAVTVATMLTLAVLMLASSAISAGAGVS